jgi:hypothetical protein
MESQLMKQIGVKRGNIPSKRRSDFIQLMVKTIKDMKHDFHASSYFHLRHLLLIKSKSSQMEKRLKSLIGKVHKDFDEDYIKYLFNIIFDSLDSISGGTLTQINERYHIHLRYYKDSVFSDSEHFCNRFQIINDSQLKKIALAIIEGRMTPSAFQDLVDPHVQLLKKYYKHNFMVKSKNLRSIFPHGSIRTSFVEKFLALSSITLRKLFLDANLESVDLFTVIAKMEKVNLHNEIRSFIIYTLLKDSKGSPSTIARKAGVTRKTVIKYAKKLSRIINPLTASPFLDYTSKFSKRTRMQTSMLRTSERSLTGYILTMPIEKRRYLVKEITEIIEILLKKYEYPYFLKKFLKTVPLSHQENIIISNKLIKLSRSDNKLTYSECSELFFILLEFYDFIEAKSQPEIAEDFARSLMFISLLAKLVFPTSKEYRSRFPSSQTAKAKKLSIADKIISGEITEDHIVNIDSFEFQQVLQAYRKHIVTLEIEKLIQRGYPSVNSREYNIRVYGFHRKNIFTRFFVGKEFIEWLEDVSSPELEKIVKLTSYTDLKREILMMCNKINQNHEILTYVLFLILKTHNSLGRIAIKSGKGVNTIRRIGRLLDSTICPITNTFYITSYERRFLN